jgi:hypothetical protein
MRFPLLSRLAGEPEDRVVPTRLNHHVSGIALAGVAAALAAALPCPAQVRVEATPFVGAYLPGAALVIDTVMASYIDTYSVSGATVRQTSALIGGAQLTAWLGKQVAVEIAGGYSQSATVTRTYLGCECPAIGGCPSSCVSVNHRSARVVTGSTRLLVTFATPRLGRPSLYVVAGWGVVKHGGPGFDAAEQTAGTALQSTYWGPIVGVGVRMPLTPTRAPRVELVRVQPGTRPQADWVLSVGLSATLPSPR